MEILVADDEKPLASFLLRGLRAEGYVCEALHELHELLPYLRKNSPQVLILDRLFGREDSLDILASIKQLPSSPMVLMLTALDEVSHRVEGLTAGADDYLCKPFDFDELLARVAALARRGQSSEPKHKAKIEFSLLLYFAENRDKVLSRERILARVWQTKSDPNTNVVDVYISHLRKKLESDQGITIETVRGSGYRLSVLV